jgi:hypothetical protein
MANAGGTPRSFVVGVPGTTFALKASGTAGRALTAAEVSAGGVQPELVLSADTLSAGAPFSITKFLQFLSLAA